MKKWHHSLLAEAPGKARGHGQQLWGTSWERAGRHSPRRWGRSPRRRLHPMLHDAQQQEVEQIPLCGVHNPKGRGGGEDIPRVEGPRPKGRGSHILCWRCMIQGGVHIPGSEGARSKTREITSHAGGSQSGVMGITSHAGGAQFRVGGSHPMLGVHDTRGIAHIPAWRCAVQTRAGPHTEGRPLPRRRGRTDPAPKGKRGVAQPARNWGLSGGGVASAERAWPRPPLGGRGPLPLLAGGGARGGRCVRGGRGGPPRSLPPTRPPPPAPARAASTREKPPSPPRAALSGAPTRRHGRCRALRCGTGASGGSEQRS